MNDETKDLFERMAMLYPALTQKAKIDTFDDIGEGWHPIIEDMCYVICTEYSGAEYALAAAIKYPRDDGGKYLEECQAAMDKAIADLPIIVQVKEKFGTLRVYVDNSNRRTSAAISFAVRLSSRTCETCGQPGKLDGEGWLRTLCEKHHQEAGNTD